MYMATSSGVTRDPYEFISQVCSSLDDMGLVMSSPRYKK